MITEGSIVKFVGNERAAVLARLKNAKYWTPSEDLGPGSIGIVSKTIYDYYEEIELYICRFGCISIPYEDDTSYLFECVHIESSFYAFEIEEI